MMLVSDLADKQRRAEVRQGLRPRPEYLLLEERHGVELLDWSLLAGHGRARSIGLSLRHVRAALARLDSLEAVFTDGEHLAVPLAMAMRFLGHRVPHLTLGHHLTTRTKWPFFRLLRAHHGIDRLLVHSSLQMDLVSRRLGVPRSRLGLVPYSADASFWSPQPVAEEALVVSAGREHRDYATLARACEGLPVEVFVASGSLHSVRATWSSPGVWPPNFKVEFVDHRRLRELYARARLVVIPLLPNDFQAGVTTLLEAMAMAKAVVVSATAGQRDVVVEGETGVLVPPGDPDALRHALLRLLLDPRERRRLGANARSAVERDFSVEAYAERLAAHLREVARGH